MFNRLMILTALGFMICLPAGITMAFDQEQTQEQVQTEQQEQVYGWQLMTPKERVEYRAKMRTLTTQEERKAFRKEHHIKMQERAEKRGVTLPDTPPAQRRGTGMDERGTGMDGRGGGKGRGR